MYSANGPEHGKIRVSLTITAGFVIVAAVLTPVWFVDNFYGADGPPHLHSASVLIKQTLYGQRSGFYAPNPVIVPNCLGHLLLAGFLLFVPAATASKLLVSITFVGFVAAATWLRWAIKGAGDILIVSIFAGVFGLNRIWLVGMYNFVLGAAVALIGFGLVVRWGGSFTRKRAVILFFCFAAAYLSHLVAFVLLVATISVFLIFRWKRECARPLLWTLVAAAPVIPFLAAYQLQNFRHGKFRVQWFVLSGPADLSGVVAYVRATDPFFILSRRYLPFSETEAWYNALAAPIVWIVVAIAALVIAKAFSKRTKSLDALGRGTIAAVFALVFLALFSPDLLGETEGSIIRARIVLIAMPLLVATLPIPASIIFKSFVGTLVAAVFAIQTAGLWEYGLRYDSEIREFLPVISQLKASDRLASVMVFDEQMRFHPSPVERISSLAGVDTIDTVVWDTYEAGYYFFPIIAANKEDRDAIRLYTSSNVIRPTHKIEERVSAVEYFAENLAANYNDIDVMMIRGRNGQVENEVARWFGPGPFYETENFRLFRRRSP